MVASVSPSTQALLVFSLLAIAVSPAIAWGGAGKGNAPPRDGLVFIGSVPGDSTSFGRLILEKDFRQTKLLRWQSTDAQLGIADSDFFQPRQWQIRGESFEELTFMDRSPDPAMRGRVMLEAPNKALVEIVVGDELSSYQLIRADIGLRFTDQKTAEVGRGSLARNPEPITSENFRDQACHMRPLRISGLGRAVLDDSIDGVVEVFDLDGRKLSLPTELKSLPVDLWISGHKAGTTGLRVDYSLPRDSKLEQEIAVRVVGEIAKGQGCR